MMAMTDNRKTQRGFTFVEVMTVAVIVGILVAVSLPPLMQWQGNMQYRKTAREISSAIREAKSRSIATNRQVRLEIAMPLRRQYRVMQGNHAANSSQWNDTVKSWVALPDNVMIATGNMWLTAFNESIEFSPNGTMRSLGGGNANIFIQDPFGQTRFTIEVAATGRVRVF